MSDYLIRLNNNPVMGFLTRGVGLPQPVELDRPTGGYAANPLDGQQVAVGSCGETAVSERLSQWLADAGARTVASTGQEESDASLDGMVFDCTGATGPDDLRDLYTFFHGIVRRLREQGCVVLIARLPEHCDSVAAAAVQRGVEGFCRSLAKELGRQGGRANLLYVAPDAEDRLEMPLRFFLSPHCNYVDGQVVRITAEVADQGPPPMHRVLDGKVALVTGAARGIGAATARRLAAEGARVICVDMADDSGGPEDIAREIDGVALTLDVTSDDAADKILEQAPQGLDVLIHNAGITRDRTLARMSNKEWDSVLAVNLKAILRMDEQLLAADGLRDGARVVCLSSIGGIAGNVGQTNYATTKAALIGYVQARSQVQAQAERGMAFNAVAPGFIETRMTDAMPFVTREGGRRMNSLSQGGKPEDVAELITFLSSPGAIGITGQTVRVCGQSLIGA